MSDHAAVVAIQLSAVPDRTIVPGFTGPSSEWPTNVDRARAIDADNADPSFRSTRAYDVGPEVWTHISYGDFNTDTVLIARGIVHARMGMDKWNAQAVVEYRSPRDIATIVQTGMAEDRGPFIRTGYLPRNVNLSDRLQPFIDAGDDIPINDAHITIGTHDGVTTLNVPAIADTLLANLPGRPLSDLLEIEATGHADIDEAVAGIRITDARSFGSAAQFDLSPAPVSYASAQCAATTLFQALVQARAALQTG